MRLLLFGGTFDPPHAGHMGILKNAIATVRPDKVLVVPAGIPPHKRASATSPALRLAMCACFLPLFEDIEISEIEIHREGKSYTWHTVQQLMRLYPGAELFLCIGSDMLLGFAAWYCYRELLQAVTLVVQSRSSRHTPQMEAAVKQLRQMGGKVLFTAGRVKEISSTQLRAAIAAGKDVWGLIPPPAPAIIKQNRLYQKEPST